MAWGYWSATSVSDRGRSPRREKDKSSSSTYQTPSEITGVSVPITSSSSSSSGVQQMTDLNVLQDDDLNPIEGSTFYTYSMAANAAASIAAGRHTPLIAEGSSSGPQSFPPGGSHHPRASTSTYPGSPGSDSAEYEQPNMSINLHSTYVQQQQQHEPEIIRAEVLCHSVGTSSLDRRLKGYKGGHHRHDNNGDEDNTDVELEDEIIVPERIYESRRGSFGAISGCRLHGHAGGIDHAGSMASLGYEHYPAGPRPAYASQVWLNDITWGMIFFCFFFFSMFFFFFVLEVILNSTSTIKIIFILVHEFFIFQF